MRLALFALVAALGLFAFDRLALWAERRGWIYYRKRKASARALGNALLETQVLLEPRARETVEALAEKPGGGETTGDPPARDDGA